jgi:23S rRNA (cytosine1962-C5)-methyltransferase
MPSVTLAANLETEFDVSPFKNRLLKNAKHWQKWAKRMDTEAWRVYDKDVPQFPFAIDIYKDFVHLQEFDTGWEQSDEDYEGWICAVKIAIQSVLNVPLDNISHKTRRRQKGEQQYEKQLADKKYPDFVVQEQGQSFWVNLYNYLDTGLFLDHRPLRAHIRHIAQGKRFLNLFAYTGSFTVYAAAGGASRSVTVDLSNTYQLWSIKNFALNQLDLAAHTCVRADVFAYLEGAGRDNEQFDLIVMDPPSFSNSKKMDGILDIQRDHVQLIENAMRILHRDGELYFSNNLRSFVLDEAHLAKKFQILALSSKTIPDDFRDKRIHQSWCIRHN